MPSRVEIHPGRHDVPANYCQQKSVSHTLSKLPHEASSRLRQKRTRFTSGGTVDNGVSTSQDLSVHRPRRHVNPNGTRLPKQIKLGSLRPSSPASPCVATDQMDCVHSRGTVVIDTAITGVEHMEDDNSFSSSVFSEHLVQPELQMVISTAPDDSVDKGKSCRSSILSADNLILTDSENKEADVVLVKDIKSMENLLIHPDSGMETPPLQTTDDAGSSEGEDENDGKDEVLMSASDSMHMSNTRPCDCDSNLPSASHPPVNEEPSDPQDVRFSESDLALLDNSSFSRILPTVESKCEFGHESTSSPGRSRLLSDANSGGVSPKNTVVHLEANDINAESLSSFPPVVEAPSNSIMTRVLTRSQTVELSKQPSSPLHCPNSRDSRHPAVPSSMSSAISAVTWLRSHTKNLDKRQSVARGIHGPNRRGSLETTSASSLSSVTSTSFTCSSEAVNCESRSISEDAPDVSTVSEKIGFCKPGFRSTTTPTVVGLHPNPSALFDQLESVPTANKTKDAASTIHVYPLRSRLRRESMRRQLHAMQSAPKAFDELPTEVLFRITHYLSIQDVFRLQLVCRRLKAIVERYLLLVKRINFSNGLPFAFLPESINDVALKRILSRTPEVTHILGFYPRQITGSYPSDFHSLGNTRLCSSTSLTYAGIVSAFRICPKLRSVELMDVELMGKLVHYLPRIKFHGMFRNRPDSWDCEYAVPLPSEDCRLTAAVSQSGFDAQSITESVGTQTDENGSNPLVSNRTVSSCHASAFFCSLTAASAAIATTSKCKPYELLSAADIKRLANKCLSTHRSPPRSNSFPCATPTKTSCHMHSSLPISASVFAHNCAVKLADLATWFEPAGESPLGHGSPSTVPHFLPTRSISFGNSLLPWYDQANLQPVPPNANATGGLDAFRNLAVAPYIQPGLPPIEAELIAAAPIGRDGIPNNQADGAPIALNNHGPVMALAFGAVFISPHLLGQGAFGAAAPVFLAQQPGGVADGIVLGNPNPDNRRRVDLLADARHNVVVGVAPQQQIPQHLEERALNQAGNGAGEERPGAHRPPPPPQPFAARAARVPVRQFVRQLYSNQGSLNSHGPWLVSPLPNHSSWIGLPHTITNLTKLDLASVAISAIPRLDNIKYLHLKWVVFTSTDPFANFSASKLQSFVMNNCSGPSRVFRFVRIFSALARAPQLMRLELVGTRFVDGLLGHIIDDALLPGRSFRNLQRLVLSSNRDSTETDIGLLLLAGQSSLNHVALQIAHTRNSLFEALACASAKFPRLENVILGYQDPYQSRLTVSELMSLGIGESTDHLFPVCTITDWGVSLVFQICPRLTSLTVRHAPYLCSMLNWKPLPLTPEDREIDGVGQPQQQPAPTGGSRIGVDEELITDEGTNENGSGTGTDPYAPVLRSLTLENCPGLSIKSLEHALTTGEPFPCLETLVMRDMYMSRFQTESCPFVEQSWNQNINLRVSEDTVDGATQTHPFQPDDVDWSKAGHLLSLSDLLNARHLGFSSISPEGIGLSSSVREVGHLSQAHGLRLADLPVRPFDLFYSIRTHHYLNNVLELDGSCGPLSTKRRRIASAFFSKSRSTPGPCFTKSTTYRDPAADAPVDFISQSTQTCICGLLELQFMWYLSGRCDLSSWNSSCTKVESADSQYEASTSAQTVPTTSCSAPPSNSKSTVGTSAMSLGGPLAFHPFPVSSQYQDLNRITTASEWARFITHSAPFTALSGNARSFITVDPSDCPGCVSDPPTTKAAAESISATCKERLLKYRPRKWIARDASIDTSELRCHIGPGPLVLTVYQPESASFSNLTSIHFEKVGISHIVLSGAPHLKNITLENCPHLQAILFSPKCDSTNPDSIPALRRIRILRCPKFAIYYLLHAVACLYPAHDENVSITFRPFGHYDEQVERVLWNRAHHAHVLVSHDYKQHESERGMEEFHSSFDQLFREVINFADMLVRRELLTVNPKPQTARVRSAFRRSEHGAGWNLVTDIPWIHEVCCSTLRVGDSHRSDQADQFYEVLSEIQTSLTSTKIQRRGIHLHVQYRDVHTADDPAFLSGMTPTAHTRCNELVPSKKSYLKWSYDELYLASNSPEYDLNAWGDGLDESLVAALPPHERPQVKSTQSFSNYELSPSNRLLLAQEESKPIIVRERNNEGNCPSLKRKSAVPWATDVCDHEIACCSKRPSRRHNTNQEPAAPVTSPVTSRKRILTGLDTMLPALNGKRRRVSEPRSFIQ